MSSSSEDSGFSFRFEDDDGFGFPLPLDRFSFNEMRDTEEDEEDNGDDSSESGEDDDEGVGLDTADTRRFSNLMALRNANPASSNADGVSAMEKKKKKEKKEVPKNPTLAEVGDEDRELCMFSSISSIANCGRYFVDELITADFAHRLAVSEHPLLTLREIVDAKMVHADSARTAILRGVATYDSLVRMLEVYHEANGLHAPSLDPSEEELLTRKFGGKY